MPDQVNELMNYLRKLQSEVQEFIDCDGLNEDVQIYLSGIRDKASTLHYVLEMNRTPPVERQVCHNTLAIKAMPGAPKVNISRTGRCLKRKCAMFCSNPHDCPEKGNG